LDVIYWKRDIESGRGWVTGKKYKGDAELQMREARDDQEENSKEMEKKEE
jgi:hypothetical protein